MYDLEQLIALSPWMILVITIWTLPWKGVALWKAAHLKSKWWFIALLIIETVGVLEILYIFVFSKRKSLKSESAAEIR